MYKVFKRVIIDGDDQERLLYMTSNKQELLVWLEGYYAGYPENSIRVDYDPKQAINMKAIEDQIILG